MYSSHYSIKIRIDIKRRNFCVRKFRQYLTASETPHKVLGQETYNRFSLTYYCICMDTKYSQRHKQPCKFIIIIDLIKCYIYLFTLTLVFVQEYNNLWM